MMSHNKRKKLTMGKQRTVHGAYTSNSLGKDGSGPIKATEMDQNRTKNFTVRDGVDWTGVIDFNGSDVCNYGLASALRRTTRR